MLNTDSRASQFCHNFFHLLPSHSSHLLSAHHTITHIGSTCTPSRFRVCIRNLHFPPGNMPPDLPAASNCFYPPSHFTLPSVCCSVVAVKSSASTRSSSESRTWRHQKTEPQSSFLRSASTQSTIGLIKANQFLQFC